MDATISIPDLDDDDVHNFQPPFARGHAGGTASSAPSSRPSLDDFPVPSSSNVVPNGSFRSATAAGPFRGAELNFQHGRSGSGTSNESLPHDPSSSSSVNGSSRFAAHSSQPAYRQAISSSPANAVSSGGGSGTAGGSGFGGVTAVVKKSSFASLKAAFKGQQSGTASNAATGNLPQSQSGRAAADPSDTHPTLLRNPFGSRSAGASNSGGGGGGGGGGPGERTPRRTAFGHHARGFSHSRSDSQASFASRSGAFGAAGAGGTAGSSSASNHIPFTLQGGSQNGVTGPAQRSNHAHHSSHLSELSATASSSAGSGAFVAGAASGISSIGGTVMPPPIPPLPGIYGNSVGGGAAGGTAKVKSGETATPTARMYVQDPSSVGMEATVIDGWAERDLPAGSDRGGGGMRSLGFMYGSDAAAVATGVPGRAPHGPNMNWRMASGQHAPIELPAGVGSQQPATPAEFALNVLLSRFVAQGALKLQAIMDTAGEPEPNLVAHHGPGADEVFDALLDSLAHVSRKNAEAVVASLLRWRQVTLDSEIDAAAVRRALADLNARGGIANGLTGLGAGGSMSNVGSNTSIHGVPAFGTSSLHGSGSGGSNPENGGVKDMAATMSRRKALASAYLLGRALIAVAKGLSRGSLSERAFGELQATAFDLLLSCSRQRTPRSSMQAAAFDCAASVIGELSSVNFMAVGDQFVSLLEQCAKNTPSKDAALLAEIVVQGVRRLKITVYPLETFEEAAEFVEILSRHFVDAHGQRLKTAYALTLTQLLLPVARSASAELNHPTWIKALDMIAPRAVSMAQKPRYWAVAYPLLVSIMCVAPDDRLLQPTGTWNWFTWVEAGTAKLKDRPLRIIIMNSAVRLIWTYLFRCRESSNATTKRLEAFYRIWFPAARPGVAPAELSTRAHICMLHYVLYRQFDVGRDLVLKSLRHSQLSGSTLSLQAELLWPQRMTVAVRAVVLTLDAHVRQESPPFPSSVEFGVLDLPIVPDTGGDELEAGFTFPTPDIATTQSTFNDLICKIALLCDHQLGAFSVFDTDTVQLARGSSIVNWHNGANSGPGGGPAGMGMSSGGGGGGDDDRLGWHYHAASRLSAAYPRDQQPYFELLTACFDSWPRCLSTSLPFASALATLFRAHFSADPGTSEAASQCLRRIARQRPGGSSAVVAGFMRYLFQLDRVFWEAHPHQTLLLAKVEAATRLWIELLNIWLADLRRDRPPAGQGGAAKDPGLEMERTSAWALIDEVEAYGMVLLCSAWRALRRHAISVLRLVSVLDDAFLPPAQRAALATSATVGDGSEEPTRVVHLLDRPCVDFYDEDNAQLSAAEHLRTQKWRRPHSSEPLSELAESDHGVEYSLWQHILPHFLRMCLERFPTTIAVFRSHITRRFLAMDIQVSTVAGLSSSSRLATASASSAGSTLGGRPSASSVAAATISTTTPPAEQALLAEHWRFYVLALCTTTTSTEGSRGGVGANLHTDADTARNGRSGGGGGNSGNMVERVIAARDLFQRLVPFLASDQQRFREAVVVALGNINANLYTTLLETTQSVSIQLNSSEEARTRSGTRSTVRRLPRNERLRTAIAQIVQLTASQVAKSDVALSDKATVSLLLAWVRDTYGFLTEREVRADWAFHRLRRFFANVVEEIYIGFVRRDAAEAESHFPFDTRLRTFRLLREWQSYSQAAKDGPAKLADLLANVAAQCRDERQRETVLTNLRIETQALSAQAASTMAALCEASVTSSMGPASTAPQASYLEAEQILTWIEYLWRSEEPSNHKVAHRALSSLLSCNGGNAELVSRAVDQCFSEAESAASPRSFFAVLSRAVSEGNSITSIPLHTLLCLGLIKLGHPLVDIRRRAFNMLAGVVRRHVPGVSLQAHAVGTGNSLPATYLRAQRDVSAILAAAFQSHRLAMLAEFTLRMPSVHVARRATTLGLLPEWISGYVLKANVAPEGANPIDGTTARSPDDAAAVPAPVHASPQAPATTALPHSTCLLLTDLLALTMHYSDEHNFEVQDMWAALAEGSSARRNASVISRFLVEQALTFRSPAFVLHARRAVSCVSRTLIGPFVFAELCALLEPSSMIPAPQGETEPHIDPRLQHLYYANLDAGLGATSTRRQIFSPGQVALSLLGELTHEGSEQLWSHLPLLLHALFMQIDSVSSFIQDQMAAMFEQLMRTLTTTSGSHTAPGESATEGSRERVETLFARGRRAIYWTHDELDLGPGDATIPRAMQATLAETISVLEPSRPDLRTTWGIVALQWATAGPVRHMACRSFQAFRALMPKTTPVMLADMLGRLSNTISDSSSDIQSFALEILYTLIAVIRSAEAPGEEGGGDLLAQITWACIACLSTINEREFATAIDMLDSIMDKVDLGSPRIIEMLRSKLPEGWEGEAGGIQPLVLRGLRSSATSTTCFRMLCRLAKVRDGAMIDSPETRLPALLLVALPWYLQREDNNSSRTVRSPASSAPGAAPAVDGPGAGAALLPSSAPVDVEALEVLGEDLAALAEAQGKPDLQRLATSMARSRFRTKDDMVRQAVAGVKSHYLPFQGPDLAVLLLGMLLNQQDWLRKQTLSVLKIFFQLIDARSSAALGALGSELLMPLLRLLSGPLAAEALDVLDEPIAVRGGPAASQILRMSLQWGKPNRRREQSSDAAIFGAPEDSGWAVAQPQDLATRTRINIQAVFKTCELSLETAGVGEVAFVDDFDLDEGISFAQLDTADLMHQLQDLSSFFFEPTGGAAGRPAGIVTAEDARLTVDGTASSVVAEARAGGVSGVLPAPLLLDESSEQVAKILARSAAAAASTGASARGSNEALDAQTSGVGRIRKGADGRGRPSMDDSALAASGSESDSDDEVDGDGHDGGGGGGSSNADTATAAPSTPPSSATSGWTRPLLFRNKRRAEPQASAVARRPTQATEGSGEATDAPGS